MYKDHIWLAVLLGMSTFAAMVGLVLGILAFSGAGLSCPPQNMLDGAAFNVDFTYPPTPEDKVWMEQAGAFLAECDVTPLDK
jgi:hypothetical protein